MKKLAATVLATQETASLNLLKNRYFQLKNQVTEASLQLQDFYQLKSFKSKSQSIDQKYNDKVAEKNDEINSIESNYSQSMKKLKLQSGILTDQINKISKQKTSVLRQKLDSCQNSLEQLAQKEEIQKQRLSRQIEQKGRVFRKEISSSIKQVNSKQSLLRSKFISLKRSLLRTIESQSQRRQSFHDKMFETLSQISVKVQAKMREDQIN